MLNVEWDKNMEIGIPAIDAQHQRLFNLIRKLDGNLHCGAATDITNLISTLNCYAIEHFAEEEKMMLSFSYPGIISHRKLHDQFISRLEGIQENFDTGQQVADNISDFLMNWLVAHILGADQEYKRFMII